LKQGVDMDQKGNIIHREDVKTKDDEIESIIRRISSVSNQIKDMNQLKKRKKEFSLKPKLISKVVKALSRTIDPEIGANIVDIGFIYNIYVSDDLSSVKIDMTLTSPFCPMSNYLASNAEENVKKIKGVKNVEINIVFYPQWTPIMMSKELHEKFFKQFMLGEE